MCMCSPTCVYIFYLFLVWKDTRWGCCILWTVIVDRCELPRWFWKPKLGPLQEQQVLSAAELSLRSMNNILNGHFYHRELYGNYYCFVMIIHNCCYGTHSILNVWVGPGNKVTHNKASNNVTEQNCQCHFIAYFGFTSLNFIFFQQNQWVKGLHCSQKFLSWILWYLYIRIWGIDF